MRQEIDWAGNHKVDQPSYEVLHGRRSPAVRHELETRARSLLKQNACHMSNITDAAGSCRRLVRIGLEPCDQPPKVIARNGFSADDHKRYTPEQRHRRKVLEQVIAERI